MKPFITSLALLAILNFPALTQEKELPPAQAELVNAERAFAKLAVERGVRDSFIVRDYDEAIDFYVNTLGFSLVEDTYIPEQDKRWVVVSPPGAVESRLLLARAVGEEQSSRIGNQTGGRLQRI
jgi:hypothetical protein